MDAAEAAPPALAARVLTAGGAVHALVHRLEIAEARAVAERAADLAGADAAADLDLCHMLAWTWELSGRAEDALALARASLPHVDPLSILAIDFCAHFVYLEDYTTGREALEATVRGLRETAAFGNLAYGVDHLANLELRTGRMVAAYAHSAEAVQLMESMEVDVGIAASLARLSLIEAVIGRAADSRAHGARALDIAVKRGDRWNEVRARAALSLEALSRRDFELAATQAEPAARMQADGGVHHPNMFRVHGDCIEALIRTGRRDQAKAMLERLTTDGRLTRSAWAEAVAARCGALLTDDDDDFAAACDAPAAAGDFERGRAFLAHGERLRRRRQVRAAREPLYKAVELLERVEARLWAERARAELRATGERLPPRQAAAHENLTPQELQVARAAADGLTNKEIAARLFLSPKTVEFHLTRVYRKLGVRSRSQLVRVFPSEHSLAASP
jgi:DNA-binding NarL/FixJ family response regulator